MRYELVTYEQFLQNKDELINKGVFVVGMHNDDYHAHEGLSSTGGKNIRRSPAHYKSNSFERTRAMEIGSAIHAAVLEPDFFKEKYMLLDDVPTRQKPEYKAAVKALSTKDDDGNSTGDGSQFVFISKECDNLRGMYRSIKNNKTAMATYQLDGFSELAAFVRCPKTGVILKAKFDRISLDENVSIDLKKFQDARKEAFTKSIGNYEYYVQAAFYCHVYKLITNQDLTFKYNAVEEKEPWGSKVYTASEGSKLLGEIKFNEAIEIYAECVKNDTWPNYEDTDEEIDVPSWVMYEYENDIAEGIR